MKKFLKIDTHKIDGKYFTHFYSQQVAFHRILILMCKSYLPIYYFKLKLEINDENTHIDF